MKKNNDNDIDWRDDVSLTVDELLRRAREEGPEALERLIESEIFKVLTEFDPRFRPELLNDPCDPGERN